MTGPVKPSPPSPLRDKLTEMRAAGIAALQRNDVALAVSSLRIVTAMMPTDMGAQRAYAAALARSGKQRDATKVLELVLAAEPKDIEAHCVIAELFIAMLRYLDAERHLNRCLELDPKSQSPHGVRARVLVRRLQRQLEEQLAAQKK